MSEPQPAAARDGWTASLFGAIGIAIVATILRYSLNDFPVGFHPDEPLFAAFPERFCAGGPLSADWNSFPDAPWKLPSYQHSPYILLHSVAARVTHACCGWPHDLASQIMFARVASCFWGGIAVLLTYFAGRVYFSSGTSLLATGILALSLLHVQDSMYARLDTFLCVLVLATLLLSARAAKLPGKMRWIVLSSLCAGLTVAAKYNAVPVLIFLLQAPWARMQAGIRTRSQAVLIFGFSLLLSAVGFFLATPEGLLHPHSLVAGVLFQAKHYLGGRLPHQAFNSADNNLIYWTRYFVWIGLGIIPAAATLLYFVRTAVIRRREEVLLALFLLLSIVMVCAPTVRFERNLEMCLGPLAVAAAGAIVETSNWLRSKYGVNASRTFLGITLAIWLWQSVQILVDFKDAVNFRGRLQAENFIRHDRPRLEVYPLREQPTPAKLASPQVILIDFGDPFSKAGVDQWLQALGNRPSAEIRSPWSKRGYPFSTLDTYHGPARILIVGSAP